VVKYEEIDRQWVATPEEADRVVTMLARHAVTHGLAIGSKSLQDGGFLITVEKPVKEETEEPAKDEGTPP
jgi:hypothetical protein